MIPANLMISIFEWILISNGNSPVITEDVLCFLKLSDVGVQYVIVH